MSCWDVKNNEGAVIKGKFETFNPVGNRTFSINLGLVFLGCGNMPPPTQAKYGSVRNRDICEVGDTMTCETWAIAQDTQIFGHQLPLFTNLTT